MSSADEAELYELLMRMDALEELLEELEERGLASLADLQEQLGAEPDYEDLLTLVRELRAQGMSFPADIEQELAELERQIEELGAPGSEWAQPN
ncbi:hypothetical protein NET03_13120 [Thermomicrobium sp. CFH 73360]|uniref:hypothetical protein n=1 Tax=Thermomicrobium sp. CFH 73360 TaxID=2951987 RepID=UPI00207736E3|nr:hypothetical protein [Thermomicrobium sp. CFH 73360]MCM8747463.1 hypothetical protein [Thermomicrobium sp. CFH 73360]